MGTVRRTLERYKARPARRQIYFRGVNGQTPWVVEEYSDAGVLLRSERTHRSQFVSSREFADKFRGPWREKRRWSVANRLGEVAIWSELGRKIAWTYDKTEAESWARSIPESKVIDAVKLMRAVNRKRRPILLAEGGR